jgi:hypothetical protein
VEIKDIDELRQHAISTLQKLSKGAISTEEAGVTGKLCENVVSTLKVQLEYAKMLDQQPNIDFLENCTLPKGRLIEGEKDIKNLPIPEKKMMRRK